MSLAFNFVDTPNRTYTHNLMALCAHLTNKVVLPFLKARGLRWDPRFEQYFLHHPTSDPFAATGLIQFDPLPMFLGQLAELESAIGHELGSLGIRTGPFTPVLHEGSVAEKRVLIDILDNPTAPNGPPEVTMGTNAGGLVLRDLLGLEPKNGRYEFTADELLSRLDTVTEQQISARCAAPSRGIGEPVPRRIPPKRSLVTARRIHRCISELRELACWARLNKCQRIEAVPAAKY
jgi:hypothetical protein